ncbi:MAG: HAD family hydrolase [Treponema sp.]|nr:HAD family hydrolase [Treponema sp.]
MSDCFRLFDEIKGIIFDFDGTLYDFSNLPQNLIKSRFSDIFRIKADRDVRRELKGHDFGSPEAYFKSYYAGISKKTKNDERFIRRWHKKIYTTLLRRVLRKFYKPYECVEEIFKLLESKEIKTAIYSDYFDVEGRMRALGLSKHICKNIYSAEMFGALKPSIRPFLHIANDLKLNPNEILVIGDRDDTDGKGAFDAGMKFLRIASKRSRKEDIETKKQNDMLFATMEWNDFCKQIKNFYA